MNVLLLELNFRYCNDANSLRLNIYVAYAVSILRKFLYHTDYINLTSSIEQY